MDYLLYLLTLFLGFGLGVFTIYCIYSFWHKKILLTQKQFQELELQIKQNFKIKKQEYENELESLSKSILSNQEILSNTKIANAELKKQAEQYAEEYKQKCLETAQLSLENELEKISIDFQKNRELYQQEYLQALKEAAQQYEKEQQQFELNKKTFESLQNSINVAIEAAKREEEKKEKIHFYHIQLSESDKNEISHLREVSSYLKDPTPLNKVIWKIYYENPTTDLINRVVGPKPKCGIYKITNMENNKSYVGQAVNIADRWRQHIKRGLGADPATKNKLYPAMQAIGVENFTFEIVEECPREQLNDKEDFWQNYFKAKDFGYSIK